LLAAAQVVLLLAVDFMLAAVVLEDLQQAVVFLFLVLQHML
jgi:hypothetical protein